MKKITTLLLILTTTYYNCTAQQYFTKNGFISFFSSAMLEDIKADNNQVISVIDATTGDIRFSLLNNAFRFKKALMEEHFNADYMESAKYPKSAFNGKISNIGSVDFSNDGVYTVSVTGDISVHGVTKNITVPATITVKAGKIKAAAVFKIKVKDYNISIPSTVKNNIAEFIEITVNCNYDKRN